MTEYTVTVPDGQERGIRIRCEDHDVSREFQPPYRTVTFHCQRCGQELELTVHDPGDWRDCREMC